MTHGGGEGKDHESNFRRLYDENFKTIYNYVGARVQNRSDIADLVAEVFATAWRRIDRIPAGPGSRAWLVGVARRVLSHHYRGEFRRGRLRDRIAAEPTPTPGDNAAALRLEWAFNCLAAKDQEVLRMMTWDELTHEEAAQVLGCSVNAVTIRLHRARRRLGQKLDPVKTESAEPLVPIQKDPR